MTLWLVVGRFRDQWHSLLRLRPIGRCLAGRTVMTTSWWWLCWQRSLHCIQALLSARSPLRALWVKLLSFQGGRSPGKPGKVREFKDGQGKVSVLACTKLGQFVLRKIIEIVASRCQILRLKCTKFDFGQGSAPDRAGGAYSAPQILQLDLRGPTFKEGKGSNNKLFHCSLLKNTVVIVVTVYMSIAVRNSMYFVLYRYCCEGRWSVNIYLKCLKKSGNLIMTGEWSLCHSLYHHSRKAT